MTPRLAALLISSRSNRAGMLPRCFQAFTVEYGLPKSAAKSDIEGQRLMILSMSPSTHNALALSTPNALFDALDGWHDNDKRQTERRSA